MPCFSLKVEFIHRSFRAPGKIIAFPCCLLISCSLLFDFLFSPFEAGCCCVARGSCDLWMCVLFLSPPSKCFDLSCTPPYLVDSVCFTCFCFLRQVSLFSPGWLGWNFQSFLSFDLLFANFWGQPSDHIFFYPPETFETTFYFLALTCSFLLCQRGPGELLTNPSSTVSGLFRLGLSLYLLSLGPLAQSGFTKQRPH